MVYRKRTESAGQFRDRAQRHQLAAFRTHVQRRQSICVPLILRLEFKDDAVLIVRREDGRYLAKTVSRVQRVFHLIGGDTESRRLVAIDDHVNLWVLYLQIAGDVLQAGKFPHLGQKVLRGAIQFRRTRTLQRELIERLALDPADADRRIVPQKHRDPWYRGKLRTQFLNDLIDLGSLRAGLQEDIEIALIQTLAALSDLGEHVRDRRIVLHDLGNLKLMLHHRIIRGAFDCFCGSIDLCNVFARQEALGDDNRQIDRAYQQSE